MKTIDTEPRPLTGEQRLRYLADGYLELQPATLGAVDHRLLYGRADELYAESRALQSRTAHLDILGDNLRARIPELESLLTDPVIDGALRSILGPDHLLHPHSYCHVSGSRDQLFHQDGNLPWNERGHYRSHRPDWVMLFYYPQDVDERNGPTEVVAGSHYWTVDHERPDGDWYRDDRVDRTVDRRALDGDDLDRRDRVQAQALDRGLGVAELDRRFLVVPAGTMVIADYDLFHRGSRVDGATEPRYLYKFYFARVHEPDRATSVMAAGGPEQPPSGSRGELGPVVAAQDRWLRGDGRPVHGDRPARSAVVRWSAELRAGSEARRVEAAYRLGAAAGEGHGGALDVLAQGLSAGNESTRRAAGHGLRVAGKVGLPALLLGLESEAPAVRRPAVAALGTVEASADPRAVTALVKLLGSDPDDLVRSNAAYSLGQMGRSADLDAGPLAEALLERLTPGVEPDNAFGAGLSRSTVRQSAAYALVQVSANHRLPDQVIAAMVDGPLDDGDRYVQGLMVEALARAEHLPPGPGRAAIGRLAGRRWNPTPRPT